MSSVKPTKDILERAAHFATIKGDLSAAERYLTRKGILTFGVESVSCAGQSIDYINFGDTYTETIIQEGNMFSVCSWGSWYESAEAEYCEDNDEIRCGYCGEFTPVDSDDWRATVCEHCERYIDTGELWNT